MPMSAPPTPPEELDVNTEHWTLDPKVPVAIIFAMIVQLLGYVWFAAKQDARLDDLDRHTGRNETQIVQMDREARTVGDRLSRLEEKLASILAVVTHVERALDKRLDDGK